MGLRACRAKNRPAPHPEPDGACRRRDTHAAGLAGRPARPAVRDRACQLLCLGDPSWRREAQLLGGDDQSGGTPPRTSRRRQDRASCAARSLSSARIGTRVGTAHAAGTRSVAPTAPVPSFRRPRAAQGATCRKGGIGVRGAGRPARPAPVVSGGRKHLTAAVHAAVHTGSVSGGGPAARGVRTRRQGGPGGLPVSPPATGTRAGLLVHHERVPTLCVLSRRHVWACRGRRRREPCAHAGSAGIAN